MLKRSLVSALVVSISPTILRLAASLHSITESSSDSLLKEPFLNQDQTLVEGVQEEEEEDKISINDRSYWTRRIHNLCAIDFDVDAALRLLDRLRLRGYRPDSLNLSSIIHALCDAHRNSEAHRRLLLSLASHSLPDNRTANVLLARLLDSHTPLLTLRVSDCMISTLPDFAPSLTNYNRLIDQLCSNAQLVDAQRVFVQMFGRGCSPNVVSYSTLINGFIKIGDLDSARRLFGEMLVKGLQPNALTHSVLLRGVLRKRMPKEAWQLMRLVWQKMLTEENSTVKNAAFTNLIQVLCAEGLYHEVFKIAEEMPQGRSVSEEFAYVQMIDSLCRAGRNHGASRIVYIMRKRGAFPSLASYNSIVHGLSKEGGYMRAYQLFKEGMEFGYSPTEPTFKVLVEGLCREHDLYKSKDVVEFMLKKECLNKTRIYNIYIGALSHINKPSELLNVLISMLQNQCQPDVVTLNTIINGFCKADKVDEALKVFNDMLVGHFCAPDVVSFTTILSGLLNGGRIGESLHLFHQTMANCNCVPNVVTYNAVICGLCKQQQIDMAMEIFKAMESNGVIGDNTTYKAIIDGLFSSNRIDEAKEFWDDVIWPSKVHDDFVYASILRGLCKVGRLNEACDFLYELVDCGVSPNIINYNIVIDCACNFGLKSMAYQIVREMKKNGMTPDAVTWRTLDKLHKISKRKLYESTQRMGYEEAVVEPSANSLVDSKEPLFYERETNISENGTGVVALERIEDPYPKVEHRKVDNQGCFYHSCLRDGLQSVKNGLHSNKREPLSRIARRVFGLL